MTTTDETEPSFDAEQSGEANKSVPWYDLVRQDKVPLPEYLREAHHYTPRNTEVPIERYTSRAWHDLEKKHLWRKVWQFACREEHLPEIGSYIIYEISGDSYIVVRSRDGIKAYVNACLHRGRTLKDYDGRASELRCSFHGFTWRLDGSLRFAPAMSELPGLEMDSPEWQLPEAKVGTWGGFVFINPDPEAGSLEEFLGDMPDHFARWDFEHRYLEAHVAKMLKCNWKVAQEAFDEGLHLGATHPQSSPYVGDVNAAVDVYGNWARQISPSGTPVEDLPVEVEDVDIVKRMLDVREGEALPIPFQQNSTARGSMSSAARERWRAVLGDEVNEVSDAELLDHWNYAVYPNFHPWGGYNRIVYRFRPNGDNHEECIFEVMFLTPYRGERPKTANCTYVGFGESAAEKAPELSTLAMVMDQDCFNMEAVQRGLMTTRRTHATLTNYQEAMIAWRHDLLDTWVGEHARGESND